MKKLDKCDVLLTKLQISVSPPFTFELQCTSQNFITENNHDLQNAHGKGPFKKTM